jgi:NADPH:quinone reductase-like Zn-dependent oxidoreductase
VSVRRFWVLVNRAYAEYVVDKEDAWAEVPASMDPLDAGALPLVTLAGTQLIEEAVRPRQAVYNNIRIPGSEAMR